MLDEDHRVQQRRSVHHVWTGQKVLMLPLSSESQPEMRHLKSLGEFVHITGQREALWMSGEVMEKGKLTLIL